jgi:hypothetical protein
LDDWSAAEVDHAPTESLDLAHELVRASLHSAGIEHDRLLGVAMGLAAPINKATGEIAADGILPGWHGIRPAAEMQARLGVRVQLENDANVGALGEKVFGAARGVDDLIYVRVSAGIGAGLILGGDLAPAGAVLLEPIRAAIERHGVAPAAGAPRVTAGTLGDRAEVLGAAGLILAQSPHALAARREVVARPHPAGSGAWRRRLRARRIAWSSWAAASGGCRPR